MAEQSQSTKGSTPSAKGAPPVRGPGMKRKKSLADKMWKLQNEYGKDTLYQILGRQADGSAGPGQDGLNQRNVDNKSSYPVRLYAPDPYDTEVKLKMEADEAIYGKKTLMQSDLDYLRRKQDQMTAAEFKQFVASMYNKNDPAQLARLNKVYPELLDEQKQIVDERFDLMKRLTMMSLTGEPQSREDLQLLFALNTGAIELPLGSPWDPASWNTAGASKPIAGTKDAAYVRGIFSPVQGQKAGTGDSTKMPFDALRWATGGNPGRQFDLMGTGGTVAGVNLPFRRV